MKELEEAVRGIEQDGLVWGGSKLVAVGFGIKKLQINLVIEDDKVSSTSSRRRSTASRTTSRAPTSLPCRSFKRVKPNSQGWRVNERRRDSVFCL